MFEFDDDDKTQFANDEDVGEQVLESLDDGQDAMEDLTTEVMDQVTQRVEEANLFKLLINQQVFAPNSARPEILSAVNAKIKQFAINELQMLLGLKTPETQQSTASIPAQFSEEEAAVLRMLIGKVLKTQGPAQATTQEVKPELKTIQAPAQKLNTVMTPKSAALAQQPSKPAAQVQPKKGQGAQQKQRKTVSKGFAKPKGTKPKAMPTAEQMINNGLIGTPNVQITAERGVSDKAAKAGQNTIGNLINQFAGGNQLHVDNSNPADLVSGDGGDTNERF